jgi:hypothetical protein
MHTHREVTDSGTGFAAQSVRYVEAVTGSVLRRSTPFAMIHGRPVRSLRADGVSALPYGESSPRRYNGAGGCTGHSMVAGVLRERRVGRATVVVDQGSACGSLDRVLLTDVDRGPSHRPPPEPKARGGQAHFHG